MSQHDFTGLYSMCPEFIASMKDSFTSHEFIPSLAQASQPEYVEALCTYIYSQHCSTAAPFKAVHAILPQHLDEYPKLITHTHTHGQ